jgi:hypothetical protein
LKSISTEENKVYDSYIDAVIAISVMLAGNCFGLEEVIPEPGHAIAYGVCVEAGYSWIIYQPRGVSYWMIREEREYSTTA